MKENDFKIDLSVLIGDLESSASATKRQRIQTMKLRKQHLKHHLKESIQFLTKFGRTLRNGGQSENKLSKYQCDMANTVANRLRNNRHLTAIEIGNAHKILDTVTEEAPELFFST